MRRKGLQLLPFETSICIVAAGLRREGVTEFHGYELAKRLASDSNRRLLAAYGTLYRALDRLEKMGYLSSRQEDPNLALAERRPPRRLYTLTRSGLTAAREADEHTLPFWAPRPRRREVTG